MFILILACSGSNSGGFAAHAKGIDNTLLQGSPGAVGVVRFVNDDSTNLPVLDDLVGLDRRAAKALMQHKLDSGSFDDITEVDDSWWVGPAALTKLESHAYANGWVPEGDDELGTWDGVTFTTEQAELTLDFVVGADEQELDALLDRRAVDSILSAGDIQTIHALSELYWIGNAAMTILRLEAVGDDATAAGCELSITAGKNLSAEDYTRLLALTTTSDAPFADVKALSLSGCRDWQDDDEARAAIEEALWNEVFFLSYSEAGQYRDVRQVGDWTSGGRAYTQLLDTTLTAIDEHAEDGDWDPTDESEAAALYGEVETMFEDIRDPVTAAPSDHVELQLYMDMSECSEEAVGVVNTETGEILVVHTFQRC